MIGEPGQRELRRAARRDLYSGAFLISIDLFLFVGGGLLGWWQTNAILVLIPAAILCSRGGGVAILRYRAYRRPEDLPVTPMVMKRRHHVHMSGGPYSFYPSHQYWADLWHPGEAREGDPLEGYGLFGPWPGVVAPTLRVRLDHEVQTTRTGYEPVEILGTPKPGKWVLIVTAQRILWPLSQAKGTPPVKVLRLKLALILLAYVSFVALGALAGPGWAAV